MDQIPFILVFTSVYSVHIIAQEYMHHPTVKVHCCVLDLMSRQILEHITVGESLNRRCFDPNIFISCTKLKGGRDLYRVTIGGKMETG